MEEENYKKTYGLSSTLNCIETNLWLGNLAAATNVAILKETKVKYLLTVNSFPLPKSIRSLSYINNKYIKVSDNPNDDLLSHFDETFEFIDSGLKKDVVLVHCYHGISRSPTVIISYLMKKKKKTLEEAVQYVKSKSELIEPNPGFLEQLKLYEIMKYTLDKTNTQYKMFRLDIALHLARKKNAISKHLAEVIQADPVMITINADPTLYKCRKCRLQSIDYFFKKLPKFPVSEENIFGTGRNFPLLSLERVRWFFPLVECTFVDNSRRVVARGVNEIPHLPNAEYNWRDNRLSEHLGKNEVCQLSYFIEPLVWMGNVNVSREGKIHCPNKTCRNKLGSFNWISGIQCPCGTEVCPGFYLIPSKVDKQNK